MYSIDKKYINEIIIEKSKFICILYPINNINEAKQILEIVKNEYKAATHYCYAYITENAQKYSDDGEPSGTAGTPILNVLKTKNLENILAIVVRYFGGIKLGAGGLVRAYTKAVTECIDICTFHEVQTYISLELTLTYDNISYIYSLINETYIKQKDFEDLIKLSVLMPYNEYIIVKNNILYSCKEVIEKETKII